MILSPTESFLYERYGICEFRVCVLNFIAHLLFGQVGKIAHQVFQCLASIVHCFHLAIQDRQHLLEGLIIEDDLTQPCLLFPESQYFKIFISQLMILSKDSKDLKIHEVAFICLMQLDTRGEAL